MPKHISAIVVFILILILGFASPVQAATPRSTRKAEGRRQVVTERSRTPPGKQATRSVSDRRSQAEGILFCAKARDRVETRFIGTLFSRKSLMLFLIRDLGLVKYQPKSLHGSTFDLSPHPA
ncbi:MAG: hypothetical protein V7K77_03260 [Nostoc sp.]|uniref:hypothetical protein n=1 Tax=Nostoc sp. TaxID=1180 RepID=UPI002FFA2AF8